MKESSRYMTIANDICLKILSGEFKEGDVIKGRSVLAGMYEVSPETIRKAINILASEEILVVKHGVGVFINSVVRAKQYIEKQDSRSSIDDQYEVISKILEESKAVNERLQEELAKMKESFKFQTKESIKFERVKIPRGCWLHNETIADVYFYNYTEATIVAVISNNETYPSPGPDYILKENDILIIVGKDKLSFNRVLNFLTYGVNE